MAGQGSMHTVKEVKGCLSSIEKNEHMKHGSGGTECGSTTKPEKHPIGKK